MITIYAVYLSDNLGNKWPTGLLKHYYSVEGACCWKTLWNFENIRVERASSTVSASFVLAVLISVLGACSGLRIHHCNSTYVASKRSLSLPFQALFARAEVTDVWMSVQMSVRGIELRETIQVALKHSLSLRDSVVLVFRPHSQFFTVNYAQSAIFRWVKMNEVCFIPPLNQMWLHLIAYSGSSCQLLKSGDTMWPWYIYKFSEVT